MFAVVEPIMIGLAVEVETQKGAIKEAVIKDMNDDNVIVDVNHPLAGHTRHFDVKIAV